MRCFKCGYQCSPHDHTEKGTDGGPTWQCERCHWACRVNNEAKAIDAWCQAMAMQAGVDEQLAYDEHGE